jgi:osmoprotectant transport system permease protein
VGPVAEDGVTVADLDVFADAARFVVDERALLAEKTWEHLLLSGAAMGVALLLALPLGVWLGHLHRGSFLAINVANVGRALPSLALIAIGIAFLGVGFTNVTVALVVLAVPPILTNAYVAVDGVEADVVEAARGMGMTKRQIIWGVELPMALPLIFAGIRTAAVFVVATATIAAVAGGGGLGDIIVNQAGYGLEGVVGAAICVSLLALIVDGALGLLQRAVTPPGLRTRGHALEPDVMTGMTRPLRSAGVDHPNHLPGRG